MTDCKHEIAKSAVEIISALPDLSNQRVQCQKCGEALPAADYAKTPAFKPKGVPADEEG